MLQAQGDPTAILGPSGRPYTEVVKRGVYDFVPPMNPLSGMLGNSADMGDGSLLCQPVGMDSQAVMYRGYMFFPNPDALVSRYGTDIYTRMMREVEVKSAINSKRNAVIASRGEVIPASSNEFDIMVADFVRWVFSNMRGSVEDFIFECLSSIIYGYSVTEKIFEVCDDAPYKGMYVLAQLKSKHPDDYEFVTDAFANITAIMLENNTVVDDTYLPVEKFVIHTYNPQFGWPHGVSDLRDVYKHYWSKDFLLKWWNIYMETFGMPLRVAKYPKGAYPTADGTNKASQNGLQAALQSIMNNSCITLPADIELEFKEASLGGAVGFQKAIEYHDKMIKTGILGETLTSGTGGAGGSSYALAKVQSETKEDAVERLRTTICDTVMGEQIIKSLVDLNYPGVKRYPKFSLTPRSARFTAFTAADIVALQSIKFITPDDYNMLRDKMGMPPMAVIPEVEEVEPPPPTVPPTDPAPAPENEIVEHAKAATLNRAPNKYEKRCDFKKMDADMNAVNEQLITDLSAIVQTMKNKMIAYLPKIFKGSKVALADINSLKLIGLDAMAKTIKATYLDVYQQQTEIMLDEIGGEITFAKADDVIAGDELGVKMILADRVNAAAEIAQIAQWKETKNWKAMKAWKLRKAAEIAGNVEAQAFWLTDTINMGLLQGVKGAIAAGVQNGADVNSMVKAVGGIFEKYIARGEIANKEIASAARLEAIVRTNTTRVFATSRLQALRENAATGNYPAAEFTAILDDRVSDVCEELDGQVYMLDDPIWGTITPPLHYNCRSTIVGVHVDDLPDELSTPPNTDDIKTEFGGTG
jgi:SPP1 gp7 family putative phage head morphogenesis protein